MCMLVCAFIVHVSNWFYNIQIGPSLVNASLQRNTKIESPNCDEIKKRTRNSQSELKKTTSYAMVGPAKALSYRWKFEACVVTEPEAKTIF